MRQMRRTKSSCRKYFQFPLLLLISTCLQQISSGADQQRAPRGEVALSLTSRVGTQDPKPTDVLELKPGGAIERKILEGEEHTYTIVLSAGQYIKVAATNNRTKFKMEMFDPDGGPVAMCIVGDQGPTDSLWMAAAMTGTYQLKVTTVTEGTDVNVYAFNLERVSDLGSASDSDRQYLAASQAFWAATQLFDKKENQEKRQAVEKYLESLALWRALGDPLGEASTLHMLGYSYGQLHEIEKSIDFYNQALVGWRALKNRANKADTLYNLGGTYSSLGKSSQAVECYEQAIALRRTIEKQAGLDYALNNLGQVYSDIGEFQLALKAHQEALQLRIEHGFREGQARSLSNISGVYFRMGDFQEALNYCLRALPIRRASGDLRGETVTLINIGSNYRELGQPERALSYYELAFSLVGRLKDREVVTGAIEDAIGRCYFDLGNYSKALDNHQQALAIRQKFDDLYGQASSLANVGIAYSRMGDGKSALRYFEQSLKLQRSIGDRRGEAITLERAGETYRELGEIKKAREYINAALDLSQSIKNRYLEANQLYDLACIEQTAGHLAEARSQVEKAITIIESSRARVAGTDLRASFLASKQDFYELDIDILMQTYRLDRNQSDIVQAFRVSEQRRARGLLDSLEEAHKNVRAQAPTEVLDRERNLRAKLDFKAESQIKLLSGNHTPEQAAAAAKELETINRDYEQVLAEIKASDRHYAALAQSTPLGLPEIQKELLDPDALLIEYSLGKERSYLWAVTSKDITAYELPGRATIENDARDIYGLLTTRNQLLKFEKPQERKARIEKADAEYVRIARRLSQTLLAPVAATLKGKRLLIVTDGALQYLPFAALPVPAAPAPTTDGPYQPMILEHEITSLPSASGLGGLRREMRARKPAPNVVAVLADAVFSKTDERVLGSNSASPQVNHRVYSGKTVRGGNELETEIFNGTRDDAEENELALDRVPFTRQEAQAILRLAPRNERFAAFDFSANRAAATNPKLGHYRMIHFATHGFLNTAHPGLSGLIFSLVDREGSDQKGFVSAQEVFDLHLPADLVVLSGCRTGLGKEIKGEGVLGLTRGFMYAGAARVAVSLWDVNDKSTADLMGQFYGGMLGSKRLRPAAALRAAQIAMWKSERWHAPYYWAAFVLQGEYR